MKTTVIVARHGETSWNLEGRWQGHKDSPLTDRGVKQAQAIAARLRDETIDLVVCSDLGRARRTSEIIVAQTGHKSITDTRLRERCFGIFDGLTTVEMRRLDARQYRAYTARNPNFVIPGGESEQQQFERNVECLEELVRRHPGKVLLLVTHGGVLAAFCRHVLGIPLAVPRRFQLWNASINRFSHDENGWWLEAWGDISHLGSNQTKALSDF